MWDVVITQCGDHWWWNAWHEATSTELSGTAHTRDEAQREIDTAVAAANGTVSLHAHRQRRAS
jgi:hypothetical protein